MLKHEILSKKIRIFKKLTGMSLSEFSKLCTKVNPLAKEVFKNIGRKAKLESLEDKLILLLVYYRTYASHEFLGYLVNLDNSNVCRLFKKLEPLVAKRVHIKKDRTLTEDKIYMLLLDATEQKIQRPKNNKSAKLYYSGKKKQHTQKIEIVMQNNGRIVNISKAVPGKIHDLTLRKLADPLPPKSTKIADLGYLGIDKITSNSILPFKKSKNSTLSDIKKQFNHVHSRTRIKVEHKFAEIKKFLIFSNVYRNFGKKYHLRFNIIAGIINLQHGF